MSRIARYLHMHLLPMSMLVMLLLLLQCFNKSLAKKFRDHLKFVYILMGCTMWIRRFRTTQDPFEYSTLLAHSIAMETLSKILYSFSYALKSKTNCKMVQVFNAEKHTPKLYVHFSSFEI